MRETQTELGLGHLPIKGERTEPRLWVKEFGFYGDFKPETERRRISLRKGLNIIWAKESVEGASGHAAGKSTFCRLLRYLLGDSTFGSEEFRPALRSKFPDAILAAEVYLDGEPWLLCRSLSDHGYHWSAKGLTYSKLFENDYKKANYNEFTTALKELFISPLGIEHYPGTEKTVDWQHLLQWLSRDQDARYSGALDWRTSGEGQQTLKAEKVNLIRLVLGLLQEGELAQQEEQNEKQREKNRLKSQAPNLSFARDRTIESLAKFFPKLDKKKNDLETELEAQIKISELALKDLKEQRTKARKSSGVDDILAAKHETKSTNKTTAARNLENSRTTLKKLRSKYNYRTGKLSKEEYKAQQAKFGVSTGFCSESVEAAIAARCPLAPSPDRDEIAAQRFDAAKGDVELLELQIERAEAQKALAEKSLVAVENELSPLTTLVEKRKIGHQENLKKLDEQIEEQDQTVIALQSAYDDTAALRTNRDELKEIEESLKALALDLAKWRDKGGKRLEELNNDFNVIASHLTRQQINGNVKFLSDSIKTTLNYQGDMSSAAFITLRLLIFDLAALLGSVRTTSHHPGFLLHDSPREADLSVHLYRRLFTLLTELNGQAENESAQYIVATTEAPPKHLQKEPWLACEPLSSDLPENRLLKAIV